MMRVCYALLPIVLLSIYLFGWRSLALILVVFAFGIATEAAFNYPLGKPVTSAVFVTCLIFSLSLPPTLPLWMAVIGIITGVAVGKMVFGGFGQNIFNPAMVGRCFIYVTFPVQMTNTWMTPMWGGIGGFGNWINPAADAVTSATPLIGLREGISPPLEALFLGRIPGSLGETSALLIIMGGVYIVTKKAAPWRLALSCLMGGLVLSVTLHGAGIPTAAAPVAAMLSGSFLFGAVFVVTEPISGAKTHGGQWIYGFMIGGLTMVLRVFSNFPAAIMFSVLIMNACVPILDQTVRGLQERRKAAAQ